MDLFSCVSLSFFYAMIKPKVNHGLARLGPDHYQKCAQGQNFRENPLRIRLFGAGSLCHL